MPRKSQVSYTKEYRRAQYHRLRAANPDLWRDKDREKGRRRYADPVQRAKVRANANAKRYGLTVEQRDVLFKNGCGVCGTTEKLTIDHNHATHEVRGALCHSHNAALGFLNDNPFLIDALQDYLHRTTYAPLAA